VSVLLGPALPDSCHATFLTTSSMITKSTESRRVSYVSKSEMPGTWASGCLDRRMSRTVYPVLALVSSGSKAPPFSCSVNHRTAACGACLVGQAWQSLHSLFLCCHTSNLSELCQSGALCFLYQHIGSFGFPMIHPLR
jgi:hypothetical protein